MKPIHIMINITINEEFNAWNASWKSINQSSTIPNNAKNHFIKKSLKMKTNKILNHFLILFLLAASCCLHLTLSFYVYIFFFISTISDKNKWLSWKKISGKMRLFVIYTTLLGMEDRKNEKCVGEWVKWHWKAKTINHS